MALVGEWGLHDGSGTTALDSSGNGRNLTLASSSLWATRGSRTGILPSASGLIGPASSLSAWSVMAWVYVDATATGWGGIVGDAAQTFWLEVGSGNAWDFSFPAGTANASTALPTGTWAHIAVTSGASLTTIYLNGASVGGYAAASPFSFGTGTWFAGATGDGSVFPGVVSELRTFDTALSAADVATWMGTPVTSGLTAVTVARSTSWDVAALPIPSMPSLAATPVRELRVSDLDLPPLADLSLAELFNLQRVTISRAASWSVAEVTASVTVTRSTSWSARQAVAVARATSWVVAGPSYAYPVAASADGRTFVDQNGSPWLGVSDAAWGLMVHVAATDLGDAAHDMGFYFRTRKSQGFNAAIVQLLVGTINNGASDTTWITDDGLTPFTDTTDTTPSPAYWARVDAMLDLAANYGITLVVYPIDTFGSAQTFAALPGDGVSQATAYGTFLGARYKARQNIVWSVGGDYDTRTDALDAVQQAVLSGIRSAGDTHLRSISLRGFPQSNSFDYATWDTATSPVDFSQVYTYNPTYDSVLKARAHTYPAAPTARPAWFYEGNYEGENNQSFAGGATDASSIRRSICWTLTSGGAGISYGSAHVWQQWMGGNGTWYERILATGDWGSPGVAQVSPLVTWWRSLPGWAKLVPDTGSALVTAGRGAYVDGGTALSTGISATDPRTNNYVTAARTPDGSLAVIYIPSASSAITVASGLMGSTGQSATWVDPSTGAATSGTWGTSYSHSGANAAGGTDWILVLQADPALISVTVTRPTTWNVSAAVATTRQGIWSVRSATSLSRSTSWGVLGAVGSARSTTWGVLAGATASRSTTWSVGRVVAVSRGTSWVALQQASVSRSTAWAVAGTLSTVVVTRVSIWAVRAPVDVSRAASWATLSPVAASRVTSWRALAAVAQVRACSWVVRRQVAADRASGWDVLTGVAAARPAIWSTRQSVEIDRATSWEDRAQVTTGRPTGWDILMSVIVERPALWGVLVAAVVLRATLWTVLRNPDLVLDSRRVHRVPAEARVGTVPAQARVRAIPGETRTHHVPAGE